MKKLLPAFPILVLLVVSVITFTTANFSGETKFRKEKADGFSISIADYLTSATCISPDAALQYKHNEKAMFLIVIPETKDRALKYEKEYTLNQYFDEASKSLIEQLHSGRMSNYYPDTINGNAALIGIIRGKGENSYLYYRLAVIETDKKFYQLLTGVDDNLKNMFDNDMVKMMKSFREE